MNALLMSKSKPKVLDWRYQNIVTPVKYQGQCGSCYAFTAIAALESLLILKNKNLNQNIDLSEQQLLDCSSWYGNRGCRGGDVGQAYEYLKSFKIQRESSYPYTGIAGTCKYDESKGVTIVENNEKYWVDGADEIKLLVVQNPVVAGLDASSIYFKNYHSGIITSDDCGQQMNHSVLIIGYGSEKNVEYWIVKNSYGTQWGERGYARIKIGIKEGTCGINKYIAFPVLN
ncbi:cathepsin l-like proteinase [Stylonychia lemnae]|uniref:Cathepsin l-like proteinase n=1 Tax=Stylonychia lemnae TaxID=5949 RepID=A0A078ALC8_STYLE|nr:cathepsin l-like proteinase [Stylonychia lemnae]|eukprot:CDW83165.1 cathepsin l-like proteinase [Stylonychia lemnae]